jgi:hypothetical protein
VVQRNDLKRDSGVIVIEQRRRYTVVFGVMIVALALGLAVSETNPYSTAGRIVIAVFFGFFIALCVWLWFAVNRRRNRIEVAGDAIRYVHWSGEPVFVISRTEADELRILRRLSDSKLFMYDRLAVPGTGAWMNLKWFSARAVRRACLACGWRFDGAS